MKKYSFDLTIKTIKFVDRTEIRDLIMYDIEHRIQQENYFKVFSIYGMGGIGKTCLISEIKKEIESLPQNYRICQISLEIV